MRQYIDRGNKPCSCQSSGMCCVCCGESCECLLCVGILLLIASRMRACPAILEELRILTGMRHTKCLHASHARACLPVCQP